MTADSTLHTPPVASPGPGRIVVGQLGAVLRFGLATGAAMLAALLLTLVVSPSCSDPTAVSDTITLKAGLAAIGAAWVAVPTVIGLRTRRRFRRVGLAWLVTAGLAGCLALVIVVQAVASPVFCF